MAEVFGVAAACIGFAPVVFELLRSVKKLKDFCHEVKNAPQDIRDLVEEIEDMSSVLADFATRNLQHAPDGGQTIQKCLVHCVKANDRVSSIVLELANRLQAHKRRTSVSFVFEKSKLKEVSQRLERVKSCLSLACQLYSISLAHAQVERSELRFQNLTTLLQSQSANQEQNFQMLFSQQTMLTQSAAHKTQSLKPRVENSSKKSFSKSPGDAITTAGPVSVLQISRFWNFAVHRALLGWIHFFKACKILPDDSPAIEMCAEGDLLGLQRMLCMRQLGINDRNERGESLFFLAIYSKQMHIARFLYEMNAAVQSPDDSGSTPLDSCYNAFVFFKPKTTPNFEELRQDLRFLIEDCENEEEDFMAGLSLQTLLKPSSRWTAKDHFDLMFECEHAWPESDVRNSQALWDGKHTDSIWHIAYDNGKSLIHLVAAQWTWWSFERWSKPYLELLSRAMEAGVDLHAYANGRSYYRGTPLQVLIRRALSDPFSHQQGLTKLLRSWVAALDFAGIDLLKYGQKETEIWSLRDFPIYGGLWQTGPRVFGFEYGQKVQDWCVFEEHPGDVYAGIFWDMVENPERGVPGSWTEPFEYVWDDAYFDQALSCGLIA